MKRKLALAILTASLYVAFPASAQTAAARDGHGTGRGHGNNSNHSGHDNDGNSAGHRQDRPHGFGGAKIVLANASAIASVASAVTSVTADLQSGSLKSASGLAIPSSAQRATYSVLAGDATLDASKATIINALSTAGPATSAMVPSFVESFAALRADASRLPEVVAEYNRFTQAASSSFIANPPPEFLAVHAVLGRLIAAAATTK